MREQREIQDADLILAYRNGDSNSFAQLVYRYEKPLITFINRMVNNSDLAEDIFQEVFIRVIKNLNDYKESGKFNSWLFGIAHNLAIDHLRKQKFRRSLFKSNFHEDTESEFEPMEQFIDSDPLPDAIFEKKELLETLALAVQELSLPLKEVFLLREHSGLSFNEISETVGRPLNTVLSQMHQAMLKIRKYLEKHYE